MATMRTIVLGCRLMRAVSVRHASPTRIYISMRYASRKGLYPPKMNKNPVNVYDEEWAQLLSDWKHEQVESHDAHEAHRIHAVYRIKSLKYRPYWEKDICEKLGLVKKYKITVHKNVPSVNKLLAKVNHLIVVKPVVFPHGLPEDESDFQYSQLKNSGEFTVNKLLKTNDALDPPVCVNLKELAITEPTYMDTETVKKEMRKKLDNYEINSEYNKSKYSYPLNQDGKEYRYKDMIKLKQSTS